MNIEDIKIGETYNVRVTVEEKNDAVYIQCRTSESAHPVILAAREAAAFSPISPENGIKNTEPSPKYDPCRKFRKGDKVRVVKEINGRIPPLCGDIEAGNVYTVSDNEDGGDVMLEVNGKYDCIDWYYLELVTPVEERVSFRVGDFPVDGEWSVWKDSLGKTEIISSYKIATHPNAKEAAEAECARLNAEWRKEVEK